MNINVLSSSKELPFTGDDSLSFEGTLHLASKALFMQSKLKGFDQRIFFHLRDYFVQHRTALALCIAQDCDKDLGLAKAEVDLCIAVINDFCLHACKREKQINSTRIYKQGIPKIVVAMHYKNFILLQIIKSIIQEIPIGNTLVIKPSKRAVLVSQKIKKALSLCGFPKGVVNLVVCDKVQFKDILGDPRVGKVDFLGTKKSADLLPKQFHEGLKQSCIKTIAKIPVLILRDAKMEQVTKQIVMQRLQDAHHLEVIAHPIIVDQSHEKELVQGLIDHLMKMQLLGLKGQSKNRYSQQLIHLVYMAILQGAVLHYPKGVDLGGLDSSTPIVLSNMDASMDLFSMTLSEPIFLIQSVQSLQAMLEHLQLEYKGLPISVYTNANHLITRDLLPDLKTMNIEVNKFHNRYVEDLWCQF